MVAVDIADPRETDPPGRVSSCCGSGKRAEFLADFDNRGCGTISPPRSKLAKIAAELFCASNGIDAVTIAAQTAMKRRCSTCLPGDKKLSR